jgi:hypothetical protein
MATVEELADETRRARKVRQIVDIATSFIMQGSLDRKEAENLVALVRERVLMLFPDGAQTFEVVYSQRFRRLIDEFAVVRARRGAVLPFPRRVR